MVGYNKKVRTKKLATILCPVMVLASLHFITASLTRLANDFFIPGTAVPALPAPQNSISFNKRATGFSPCRVLSNVSPTVSSLPLPLSRSSKKHCQTSRALPLLVSKQASRRRAIAWVRCPRSSSASAPGVWLAAGGATVQVAKKVALLLCARLLRVVTVLSESGSASGALTTLH